ncbi:MAG: ATP-dependent DNA helicase RecG [Pseudomonadota bacterium]
MSEDAEDGRRRPEPRGRPELLFPLFSALDGLDGIGPKTAKHYGAMGVETPKDLLLTLPIQGIDRARRETIQGVAPGDVVTLEVTVAAHRKGTGRAPSRVEVEDGTTRLVLVFFHARGDYLERILPIGARRVISGKLEYFDGVAQIAHPDHIVPPEEAASIPPYEPVYPLTAGVTQKALRKAMLSALPLVPILGEWIDLELMREKGWPAWSLALEAAHHPDGLVDLSPEHPARQRLAYDELFAHQLTLAIARQNTRKSKGLPTQGDGTLRARVLGSLPYEPTGAQSRAIAEIAEDLAQPQRMNRLLQGDVGAGKTLVAMQALLIAVEAGGQGVMMAPTTILAGQHYAGLAPLAEAAGVRLEILTGQDKAAERREKLAALKSGEIDILVGTHAVFQDKVEFRDLRLAVIDEQHRFGVAQRVKLGAKGRAVDILVMTATPIPRTLSLAQYGDMDISVLDEKPPGRQPITTALIPATRLDDVVERLRQAVAEGRQAYWVCPLVGESEVSEATAAEERFKDLRARLGEGVVGLIHGQLSGPDKAAAMADFAEGRTRVLVATTVIEVGVDVPNATIMVIEQAENFGLAQLHQLRGRVGRGSQSSTCLLIYRPPLGETATKRLQVLRESEDGFRIAEEDLALRGAGDLIGTAQSGLPRFRIADLERQTSLMALAQRDARALLARDSDLSGPRGHSARVLLWLLEQDKAIRLISVA